jgi:hypothetical protein
MILSIRWLILIPACIAAWYVALFAGILLHGVLFSYCPPSMVAYGTFCDAEWFPTAERILICSGAALSAVFVVTTASLVAPAHRIFVSRLACGVGAIVATIMAVKLGTYAELISAIAAGVLAAIAVSLIIRRSEVASDRVT